MTGCERSLADLLPAHLRGGGGTGGVIIVGRSRVGEGRVRRGYAYGEVGWGGVEGL